MASDRVIQAAKLAIDRILKVRRYRHQLTNGTWAELANRKLEEATLNLIRESCGDDSEVAQLLGKLSGSPTSDPQSSTPAPARCGGGCNCESYSQQS